MIVRSGLGFDLHPLVEDRPLVLGGVTVPSTLGLGGHSDADEEIMLLKEDELCRGIDA